MSITIRSLSPAIGAEVLGVDLAREPDAALAAQLNDALLEHVVLVVREQSMTPAEYVRAMRGFGTPALQNHVDQYLDGHPEIWVIDSRRAKRNAAGEPILYGATSWHTDHTNQQRPPKITALYARKLPPSGGDTCFANAWMMYERLPAATRERIGALRTVNGADRHLPLDEADRAAFAEAAVHPLVRRHPETGRRSLYFHPLKVQHIEGMAPEPSHALLDELLAQSLSDELVYRHRWRPGDLVLIDNRACLHLAQRDYDTEAGRVMHRIIIEGDRPQA